MRAATRLATALVAFAAVLATLVTAAPTADAKSDVVELDGPFTGQLSAAGSGTFDGEPATFEVQWAANAFVDLGAPFEIPRHVYGTYVVTTDSGSVTIRFNSILAEATMPRLEYREQWAIVDGAGAFERTRGGGRGSTLIDLVAGPSMRVAMELRLND